MGSSFGVNNDDKNNLNDKENDHFNKSNCDNKDNNEKFIENQ